MNEQFSPELISEEIQALASKETVNLDQRISTLSLYLFSLLRRTRDEALLPAAFVVVDLQHWMRKLTALACLKYFRHPRILEICQREIRNEKREVRDAAALCMSFQNLPAIRFQVYDNYQENEGMAMLCGYYLQNNPFRQDVFEFLLASLQYSGKNLTEQNYVLWYAARAAARAFSGSDELTAEHKQLYAQLTSLLANADQKTRKAAAEAAGLYVAYSDEFDGLAEELAAKVSFEPRFDAQTHGVLMALNNAVLIKTGTHNFFVCRKQDSISESTIERLLALYERLPVDLEEKQQSGTYQNAVLCALLPQASRIFDMLDRSHPACLDAGINAVIYMAKYFSLGAATLRLPLKMLTFHQSKPISVLAERALASVGGLDDASCFSELLAFAIKKMDDCSPDIRECAVRLVIWWMKALEPRGEDFYALKSAIVRCTKNTDGGTLSQMPQKSAYESLELLSQHINCDDLIDDCLEYLRSRSPFATSPVRFLAQASSRGLACCVLNAFDVVSCDISDICRQCVALASRETLSQDDIIAEAELLLQHVDSFALSGIARLCFALKHAGIAVDRLAAKLDYFRSQSEDQWDEELYATHDAYAKAVLTECESVDCPAEFFVQKEFDEQPEATAAFLQRAYRSPSDVSVEEPQRGDNVARAIFKMDFDRQAIADLLLDSHVLPEIKQKICCGICGLGELLPEKSGLDVKANEVVIGK